MGVAPPVRRGPFRAAVRYSFLFRSPFPPQRGGAPAGRPAPPSPTVLNPDLFSSPPEKRRWFSAVCFRLVFSHRSFCALLLLSAACFLSAFRSPSSLPRLFRTPGTSPCVVTFSRRTCALDRQQMRSEVRSSDFGRATLTKSREPRDDSKSGREIRLASYILSHCLSWKRLSAEIFQSPPKVE
jgi:hypothetical protein